jgi:hypothetical protein
MAVKKFVKEFRFPPSPVLDAVNKVGGARKAAVIMDVPVQSVYNWLDKKTIGKAAAAVLLARASGISLDKLVGLK